MKELHNSFQEIIEKLNEIRKLDTSDFICKIPTFGRIPQTHSDYLRLYSMTFMNGVRPKSKKKYDYTSDLWSSGAKRRSELTNSFRVFGYCYTNTYKYNEIIREKDDNIIIFYNSRLPIMKVNAKNIAYIGVDLHEFEKQLKFCSETPAKTD